MTINYKQRSLVLRFSNTIDKNSFLHQNIFILVSKYLDIQLSCMYYVIYKYHSSFYFNVYLFCACQISYVMFYS